MVGFFDFSVNNLNEVHLHWPTPDFEEEFEITRLLISRRGVLLCSPVNFLPLTGSIN